MPHLFTQPFFWLLTTILVVVTLVLFLLSVVFCLYLKRINNKYYPEVVVLTYMFSLLVILIASVCYAHSNEGMTCNEISSLLELTPNMEALSATMDVQPPQIAKANVEVKATPCVEDTRGTLLPSSAPSLGELIPGMDELTDSQKAAYIHFGVIVGGFIIKEFLDFFFGR